MAAAVKRVRHADRKRLQAKLNEGGDGHDVSKKTLYDPCWSPTGHTALKVFLSARLSAAIWSNISDCDETFNYWEPTHYLIHNHGFQTWEYSPMYAIRSYAYLWLYAWPLKLVGHFLSYDKVIEFIVLRCFMAVVCVICETFFYKAVQHRFGNNASRLCLLIMMFSPGMFISSTAFLPSTFAMYTTMLSWSCWWYLQSPGFSIFFVAFGSLLGWPFAVALGVPIALDIVVVERKFLSFICWSLLGLILCLIPLISIDSYYYGKLVVAPMNILLYNVFSEHGPELYGVESWEFYFLNSFLNFNFAFPLALVSLLLLLTDVVIKGKYNSMKGYKDCISILGLYIWILIFFTRPHKEERFLFPIYPLICLCAAVSFDYIQRFVHYLIATTKTSHIRHHTSTTNLLAVIFSVFFVAFALSRIYSLHNGYHAPLKLYSDFNKLLLEDKFPSKHKAGNNNNPMNICVGKEWYRFPSHFFLPDNCHLKFLKSEFKGQLPKEYSKDSNATRIIPTNMNDRNLEELDRYVDVSQCHFLIDMDNNRNTKLEPNYSRATDKWKVILSERFLDSSQSHSLFRAFYIPYISSRHVTYNNYNVLMQRETKKI